MLKLLFTRDIDSCNVKNNWEYLVIAESDEFYFIEISPKVTQMIRKDDEGFYYEIFL